MQPSNGFLAEVVRQWEEAAGKFSALWHLRSENPYRHFAQRARALPEMAMAGQVV